MFSRVSHLLAFLLPSRLAMVGIGGAGALGLVGIAALVNAAIPAEDGTILGCYHKNSGNLRVVEQHGDCRGSENSISWNQEGPIGPQGPSGEDAASLASIEDLKGLPCTFGNQTGTVDVTMASTVNPVVKSIDLTCVIEPPPNLCDDVELPVVPNASTLCDPESGQISYACLDGFADSNGDLGQPGSDGCEFGPDADGDGVLGIPAGLDCDDQDPLVPGPEIPGNGLDDDCDGQFDESLAITGMSLSSDTVHVGGDVWLTVTLNEATTTSVVVTLTCTPPTRLGGCSTLTLPAGSRSGEAPLIALELGTVDIVATLGTSSDSIQLQVQ